MSTSNFTESKDGIQETPEFSLTKVVEDVSHQGSAQTEALTEKQKILVSLKTTLSDLEKKYETAEQELRSKVREILMLEGEMEHLEIRAKVLHDRCASINKESAELQICISEEEEHSRMALVKFSTYRNKMRDHRAAVLHAASQTEAHKELEEKKVLLGKLKQKKEQLKEDLENPNGNSVQMQKREIDALKREISERKMMITERREELRKEFETHVQLKKDIEIQNKRHEAIIKRLHCQLSRAQAIHRQMSDEVLNLHRQLAELKRQQQLSQDSAVNDY